MGRSGSIRRFVGLCVLGFLTSVSQVHVVWAQPDPLATPWMGPDGGVVVHHAMAAVASPSELEGWLVSEAAQSLKGLFANISPADAAPGAVTASPSRREPDYFYHWVRDAALVMSVVMDLFERGSTSHSASVDPFHDRGALAHRMDQYVEFSHMNQNTRNYSGGLGEPKFHMDGSAFTGEWGRPQNDGPALRAITLTRYARALLAQGGREDYVRSVLYDGKIPSQSVIKLDLEFVSHHWHEPSFDPWEETMGHHFYIKMVQRRSLIEGAELAETLGDVRAAGWYRSQAQGLEAEIMKHWDPQLGYFAETIEWAGGCSHKASGLDVAVVLGALHGSTSDHFLSPGSDQVVATASHLQEAFQKLYGVNQVQGLGVAIGRYPEDIYDGITVGERPGNPWVLATFAFAELNYRIAQEWRGHSKIELNSLNLPYVRSVLKDTQLALREGFVFEKGSPDFNHLIQAIHKAGDGFMLRVKHHSPADGALAEQMNRVSGFMQGARDLTWSYASFLTAVSERNKAKNR